MKKALFLDRDGIINVDKGHYISTIQDFEFVDGIFELCKKFANSGFLIFIVTNQSGISRGIYSLTEFNRVTEFMTNEFKKHDINITRVYVCPHENSGVCGCRKPSPKNLIDAQKSFDLDLKNSYFIGDRESDMQTGENASIQQNNLLFVKTHYPTSKKYRTFNNLFEIINELEL